MDRRELIDKYANGGEKLAQAIRGLTDEDMRATPGPGNWSTHQVVIHLADAEAALADRMKRVIASDSPALLAWDENKFAANLFYDEQSAQDAVTQVEAMRRQVARILRKLPDSAFARVGQHSDVGPLTLQKLVETANSHLDHHLKFIYDKRERLGKLMW
jgi:uncharacterized damage-inducible protein DinB